MAGWEAARQPSPLPLADTPTGQGGARGQAVIDRLAGRGVEQGGVERAMEGRGREGGGEGGGAARARGLVITDDDYGGEREGLERDEGEEEMDMEEEEEGGSVGHLAGGGGGGGGAA